MSKAKGIAAERELLGLLWAAGWGCARIAGSGCSRYPAADLIAGNGSRLVVIECKVGRPGIPLAQAQRLRQLAARLGAETWLGLRLKRSGWRFLKLDELRQVGKALVTSSGYALAAGLSLEQMLAL